MSKFEQDFRQKLKTPAVKGKVIGASRHPKHKPAIDRRWFIIGGLILTLLLTFTTLLIISNTILRDTAPAANITTPATNPATPVADLDTPPPADIADISGQDAAADGKPKCTSILPSSWCDSDGNGIAHILNLILNLMTLGMGLLATAGFVISGIQWMTARDKDAQIAQAKDRMFNITIGLVIWGIMWLLLSWLLPGGIKLTL